MDRTIDLLDGSFYVSDPYSVYAWMREEAPVYWDATNELWGISRYDDITEIERRPEVFVNSDTEKGGYRPNLPADPSIIGLDDPHHALRRKLVARRFTPKATQRWETHIRTTAARLIDAALQRERVDVIEDLAAPLPASMIGLLLGFPEEQWSNLRDWSERTIVLGGGPRYLTDDGVGAAMEFAGACAELYEAKRGCPADDVMTLWTRSEVPGHEFGLDQVIADCLLLLDGGAETTRTVIARTLLQLVEQPDQWALLKDGADLVTATEEFIRYVSPIHNMCRTAVADYELHGTTIRCGQQVVLMYPSANRDPRHFTEPERFDVLRQPNQHLAFGSGPHFCLGSSLARLEIRIFFEELLHRVDHLVFPDDGEVVEMPNPFVYGLKSAPIRLAAI